MSTSVAPTSVSTVGIPPIPEANVNAPAVQLRNSPNRYLFGHINGTETIYANSVTTTTTMSTPVNSDNKHNHSEFVPIRTPPVSSAIDATAPPPLKRNKQVSVTTEQNSRPQAKTNDHDNCLQPPLLTLPLSSISHDIAEIGQLIKQLQVRTPMQTSPTVQTITSPITFASPQQTSTIIAREKEYDTTTTLRIASPKTMSPIIAPSVPTTFSNDYDT